MYTRRSFLSRSAAGVAAATVLPYAARAQSGGGDVFETDAGQITVHPVQHASFVMETPAGIIYNDPVGDPAMYAAYPPPDLILISHEHQDHYAPDTLLALAGDSTQILTNPAVYDMLPEDLKARASAVAQGEQTEALGIRIEAIPAYNTTEDRLKYHPQGRDNGYVLNIDGRRVYIAGDTEDTPEMRGLQDIDLAFLPMNLPYTMSEEQAASAVEAFQPTYVYPYHYRDSDPGKFAELVAASGVATEVRMGPWYTQA